MIEILRGRNTRRVPIFNRRIRETHIYPAIWAAATIFLTGAIAAAGVITTVTFMGWN